jgi:taurine dioxygenase
MNTTKIIFRPISPVGGAEVLGLDLRQEQGEVVRHQIREACVRYSFLLIRGQDITSDEQFCFGSIFGEVLENNYSDRAENIVSSGGTLPLHFDHWLISDFPQPMHFTMLYGMKVAAVGGETVLANVRAAYQRLPEPLKAQIEGMQAVHCYDYSDASGEKVGMRVREANIPPGQPCATHPVVLTHPDTGEKILYVSLQNTDRILGLAPQESETLLEELRAYIDNQDNVYVHKWRVHDLIIWDNNAMLHGRRDFDKRYKRHLRRISIL